LTTPYHSKYYAYELSRQGGLGVDRLSRSLFDACVDLNPHQIEAALFAMRSPISKGAILADEVGLGKTIEASLVICQNWAEGKRKILVITPASLRKQWALELYEKFNLPATVLDARIYKQSQKDGNPSPFDNRSIVICSLHYAARKADELKAIPWDLVVIDEAHKLRNAYRKSNRIGQQLQWALEGRKKLLLTATPLQNSLLELYGLSFLIDQQIFGDLPSFRSQYTTVGSDIEDLRSRLKSFCKRTLRSQVLEYIKFTERKLITRPFKPTEQEQKLYEAISAFLQRTDNYSIPSGQRHLITLLVRKVLASSPHAVAGTLEMMKHRLIKIKDDLKANETPIERFWIDGEMDEDLLEELLQDQEDSDVEETEETEQPDQTPEIDPQRLQEEIEELDRYSQWARSIGVDTKTRSLLKAVKIGFAEMAKVDAAQKAIIFTESRRSQQYVKDFLESNGYAGNVITFNGSNSDPESTAIYRQWVEDNKDSTRVSGSKAIDVRTALIDHFRDSASIMIATEAGAEGINLQFCSLVINYDLPWNPQRIEQRIGRCHRYGQKHDVVVINFLNEKNDADRRVYELLGQKFNLFTGVFGASDEVLGALESGIDFERKVLDIYQQCRSPRQIEKAFAQLQKELEGKIQSTMQSTRKALLEYFDEDVHSRLKVNLSGARQYLDRIGKLFWSLTRNILQSHADFNDKNLSFLLSQSPAESVKTGTYHLISKEKDSQDIAGEFLYRLTHPLGEHVIETGRNFETRPAHITFDITNHQTKISLIEKLKGKSGYLILQQLKVESFENEEYLLFSGFDDAGSNLSQETCEKLFLCNGSIAEENISLDGIDQRLTAEIDRHTKATVAKSLEENSHHFNEAREQLFRWAEDMELAAQKELDDSKNQIKALNRQSRLATTVSEQHEFQEKIKILENKKRKLRQRIFDLEDQIAQKRDDLIDALEMRMQQKTQTNRLFAIKWTVK